MDGDQFDAFDVALLAPKQRNLALGQRQVVPISITDVPLSVRADSSTHVSNLNQNEEQEGKGKQAQVRAPPAKLKQATRESGALSVSAPPPNHHQEGGGKRRRKEKDKRKAEQKARNASLRQFTNRSENLGSMDSKSRGKNGGRKKRKARVPFGEVFEEDTIHQEPPDFTTPIVTTEKTKKKNKKTVPKKTNPFSPLGIFGSGRRSTFVSTPSPTTTPYRSPSLASFQESDFYSPNSPAEQVQREQMASARRRQKLVDMITENIVQTDQMMEEMEQQRRDAELMVDKVFKALVEVQKK